MGPEFKFRPLLSYMDIFDLLNSSKENSLSVYFFGQTKDSLLIGPSINDRTCINCFETRLISSSFIDKKSYLPVSKRSRQLISGMVNAFNLENKMIELDKKTGKVIFTHYLICVPGCKKNEKQR